MDFNLADHQHDFLTSMSKFCLLAGGIGSGKSFVGSHYSIGKIFNEPKAKGFIGANTYKQLNNATLATLFQQLDLLNIPFDYNQMRGILTVYSTQIYCFSLDNYQAIRGIEIGWFWLDECRDTKEDAFLVVMGRLRDKNAKRLEGRLTSSPCGFEWMYDYFAGDKKNSQFELIQASSKDNPYLPEGYVDTLEANYDSKVYQQEVLGQFINISVGRIYYGFDRVKHLHIIEFNRDHTVFIGMDFNVNPMSAVACQYYNDVLYILDEFWIMSSNTHEIGDQIIEKFGHKVRIIPDSTGKAIKTSAAGLSDHEILRQKGLRVISATNPFRMDRYNAVNNLFEKNKVRMHPKCLNLIKDLEQVSFKEGSNLPDTTTNKDLTHISDALGYVVWHFCPITRPKLKPRMMPR